MYLIKRIERIELNLDPVNPYLMYLIKRIESETWKREVDAKLTNMYLIKRIESIGDHDLVRVEIDHLYLIKRIERMCANPRTEPPFGYVSHKEN